MVAPQRSWALLLQGEESIALLLAALEDVPTSHPSVGLRHDRDEALSADIEQRLSVNRFSARHDYVESRQRKQIHRSLWI